jgi:hypothetical protein
LILKILSRPRNDSYPELRFYRSLERLSKRENKSLSSVSLGLIETDIALEEDRYFSNEADKLFNDNNRLLGRDLRQEPLMSTEIRWGRLQVPAFLKGTGYAFDPNLGCKRFMPQGTPQSTEL